MQRRGQIETHIGVVGLEGEGAFEVRDGAVGVALLLGDETEVLDRGRVLGVFRQHPLEGRAGVVEASVAEGHDPAVEGELGIHRSHGGKGGEAPRECDEEPHDEKAGPDDQVPLLEKSVSKPLRKAFYLTNQRLPCQPISPSILRA
jgi:hypothetical protein